MHVIFLAAVAVSVLIGAAHSEKGDRIPDQIVDQIMKQLFSVQSKVSKSKSISNGKASQDRRSSHSTNTIQQKTATLSEESPNEERTTMGGYAPEGDMYSPVVLLIDYFSKQLSAAQVELFNSDFRLDEIFRNIFLSFKDYLLKNLILTVKYRLYTHRNEDEKFLLFNQTSLEESGFDSSLDTKIIIHGYSSQLLNTSVFFVIKDQLLLEGNYNVIVVDWTDYNQGQYPIVVLCSYFVGFELTNLIGFLMNNTGASAESFHIIGHSVGAHIGGIAGKLTPNLGRITSLDAAALLFESFPKYFKVAQGDAKLVDAIHTNGGISLFKGAGIKAPYGDQDFFPNGGSTQPGCEIGEVYLDSDGTNTTVVSSGTEDSCNHNRASMLFLASINECRFKSVHCGSYEDFLSASYNPTCHNHNSTNQCSNDSEKHYHSIKYVEPRESNQQLSTNATSQSVHVQWGLLHFKSERNPKPRRPTISATSKVIRIVTSSETPLSLQVSTMIVCKTATGTKRKLIEMHTRMYAGSKKYFKVLRYEIE
ncbi:hypothetical protein JTE90_010938 [Oedothorax gibbosus]|uniref:Lipase domain-containing protein n=1 Tax=Oedothorax gibbosus TaxID=931172 RepID=A0AAV6UBP8_9ARAC|nr:hypothetical protein JTE90_010938 [Oedothorax gibbosus]